MGKLIDGDRFLKQKAGRPTGDLFERAFALEESDPSEAIRLYEQALEIDPRDINAHLNLGTLLYHREYYSAAKDYYLAAIAIDQRCSLAHFNLGCVLAKLGDLQEAIVAYEATLQIFPGFADAYLALAFIYAKNNDRRNELRHWRAYIAVHPSGEWRAHAESRVRQLLRDEKLAIVPKGTKGTKGENDEPRPEQLSLF